MNPFMHNHHSFISNETGEYRVGSKRKRGRETKRSGLREREKEHRRKSKIAWVEK
jgi:hypothetical protein